MIEDVAYDVERFGHTNLYSMMCNLLAKRLPVTAFGLLPQS